LKHAGCLGYVAVRGKREKDGRKNRVGNEEPEGTL
jgi:hypothetical protein